MPKNPMAGMPLIFSERTLRDLSGANADIGTSYRNVGNLAHAGAFDEIGLPEVIRERLAPVDGMTAGEQSAIQRSARNDQEVASYRAKMARFEASCLQLIRTKLIDVEPRTAAAIVVGFCPSIYSDRAKAIAAWEKVVIDEQRKAKRSTRGKSAVDRRKSYRGAVAKLDPPKRPTGMRWSERTGFTAFEM